MKVVHVLKRIELIDADIRDLKKLEKSIAANKSFSTPLYMSIEKQINILLADRIKMLELTIANPPATLVEMVDGKPSKDDVPVLNAKAKTSKSAKPKIPIKPKPTKKTPKKAGKVSHKIDDDDDEMSMLTQDLIDAKFSKAKVKAKSKVKDEKSKKPKPEDYSKDKSIKLIDIALEKGTLSKRVSGEEKKIRFFRENFPVD